MRIAAEHTRKMICENSVQIERADATLFERTLEIHVDPVRFVACKECLALLKRYACRLKVLS